MANNILLPPQLINFSELKNQLPGPPFNFSKFFFQCELREITAEGDAVFGVVAYAAWKRGNAPRERWIIGTKKVVGLTMPGAVPSFPIDSGNPLDRFTAFGNNEILHWHIQSEDKKQYGHESHQNPKFLDLLNEALKENNIAEKSTLTFKAYISKNPHVSYDVTLSTPTGTETQATNPCPPYSPGE